MVRALELLWLVFPRSIFIHTISFQTKTPPLLLYIHTLTLINIHTLGILCSELHTLFFAHQSSLLQKIM